MNVSEADAFETFVAANYASVWRALSLATGSPQRADDMTQEAFARAYRNWQRVSRMERPVAWVYVVGVNAARRSFRRPPLPDELVEVAQSDHANQVVAVTTIRAALARLTPRQRLAVVLRHLVDLSTADVAAAMGCAEGTVKSTLHAAMQALRIDLDEEEDR